jgi:hypothetical protein
VKRHPLLIHQRRFQSWRWPALTITAGFAGLWWFAPQWAGVEALILTRYFLLAATGLALALSLFAIFAPAWCYVQCRPKFLQLTVPFFSIAIAYSRIRNVRPVKFTAGELRGMRRNLVEPFVGRTAVAVDLKGYPLAERWLRFWLGGAMFLTDRSTGLQIVTEDWMALSRDLDAHRAEARTRLAQRKDE